MNDNHPEVVVFDLGKVLIEFDFAIAVKRIVERSSVSLVEVNKLIHETSLVSEYETGEITTAAFYQRVKEATEYSGSQDQFAEAFGDIFTEIPNMIGFNRALRAKGVPTFIFSNTNEIAVQHIRKNYPFFSEFSGFVFSYEHKSMKPTAKLYEVVEEMTGKKGREIVYIDDREENIEGGRLRGWHSVWHKEIDATIEIVQELMAHKVAT